MNINKVAQINKDVSDSDIAKLLKIRYTKHLNDYTRYFHRQINLVSKLMGTNDTKKEPNSKLMNVPNIPFDTKRINNFIKRAGLNKNHSKQYYQKKYLINALEAIHQVKTSQINPEKIIQKFHLGSGKSYFPLYSLERNKTIMGIYHEKYGSHSPLVRTPRAPKRPSRNNIIVNYDNGYTFTINPRRIKNYLKRNHYSSTKINSLSSYELTIAGKLYLDDELGALNDYYHSKLNGLNKGIIIKKHDKPYRKMIALVSVKQQKEIEKKHHLHFNETSDLSSARNNTKLMKLYNHVYHENRKVGELKHKVIYKSLASKN